MRCVKHQRTEKGFVVLFDCVLDEVDRCIGEHIADVASGFNRAAIMKNLVRKMVSLDVAVIVSEKLVKPAFLRLIVGVFPQVPLAEQSGSIAGLFEQLCDRDFAQPH